MRSVFQRDSRWNRCLWLVLLLSVLVAMSVAVTHVHTENKLAHDHCSLCQMASELVAVCVAILAILLLKGVTPVTVWERTVRLALWKPTVPRVRPPPAFLFV